MSAVLALTGGLAPVNQAATVDFEGPEYVAGQRPPAPWTDSYAERGDTAHSAVFNVVAGQGVGGSQCLSVGYTGLWEGYAVYLLPRPMTPADGAQRVSVKFDPPANTQYNFATYGSVYVGDGWMQTDVGRRAGITFRLEDWDMAYPHQANDFQIVSPGGALGYFTADPGLNYYELIFEVDAAWTNMTFTVIPPDGQGRTNSYPWPRSAIDKVWLGECTCSSYDTANAAYDDFVVPTLSVGPVAPQITSQPLSRTNSAGTSATFGVAATGTEPLSYLWHRNDLALSDAANVSGAATATLTLTSVSVADAGQYLVVVTNVAGSVTSQMATLTVATATNLPAKLVALWPAEGNANDLVGTNHGTLANGVTFATGKFGQAFSFDGVDDAVFIPESPAIDLSRMSNWTVTAWVKPASFANATWPTIYSEGRWGASLGLAYGSGKLESWIDNSYVAQSDSAVLLGEWNHVALVYNGVNRLFYINGFLGGLTPAFRVSPVSDGSAIGDVTSRPNSSRFQGLIDEVAVYSGDLTAAEVEQIAGASSTAVRLRLESVGANLLLTWPQGMLQEANEVTGPWNNLPEATSPRTVAPHTTRAFYRVRVGE